MARPSTTALPADLLARSPEEAVRRVAHEQLREAAAARERLADPGDAEALHDFRVAIRRLRSTVRAYRDTLRDSVGDGARKRLRRLARATGEGRDLEVQLAWLETQRASLSSRHRAAAAWLRERLRARKATADVRLQREVGRDFDRLHARLTRRLPVYWQKVRIDAPLAQQRFAALLAARLRESTAELGERIAAIDGPEAVEPAHDARIAAKRVRYLLEPVLGMAETARPVVKRLRRLQELLGELHDLDVMGERLADALRDAEDEMARLAEQAAALAAEQAVQRAADAMREAAAVSTAAAADPYADDAPAAVGGGAPSPLAEDDAEERRGADRRAAERRAAAAGARRDPRPGLLALARRAVTRREALFATLTSEWLRREGPALVAALDGVAAALETESAAGGLPMEVERKYLLRAVPHVLRGTPSVEIAQGWLPGDRLLERVRRVRRGAEDRYYRTVKLGRGVSRIEVEEETTRALFDVLWPATRERRVRKRRYAVPDGTLTWEVDVFTGRELVLAELELPSADTPVTIPPWLAPYLVREVTDDSAYVNANLAQPESDGADGDHGTEAGAPLERPRVAPVRTVFELPPPTPADEPAPAAPQRPRIVERVVDAGSAPPAEPAPSGDGAAG